MAKKKSFEDVINGNIDIETQARIQQMQEYVKNNRKLTPEEIRALNTDDRRLYKYAEYAEEHKNDGKAAIVYIITVITMLIIGEITGIGYICQMCVVLAIGGIYETIKGTI